jgi:hypothetical protein
MSTHIRPAGHTRFTNLRLATCPVLLLPLLLAPLPAAGQQGGAAPQVRLERLLSLGGDFAGRDVAFQDVADIAAAPSGEMYVLDAGDKSVRVFNAAGRLVRRFGREGGGPGEFNLPVSLRVDSLVAVSDLGQQRMSYFTLNGRHVRTVRNQVPGGVSLLRVVPLRHGRVVGTTAASMRVTPGGTGHTGSPYSGVVVAGPGSAVDTLLRPHTGFAIFHPREGQVPFGTFDTHAGQGGAHAVLGDSVLAAADGYTGEVRWYRSDRQGLTLFRTRQLQSRSRAVTPDDVRRMEREMYAQYERLPRGLVVVPPPRISIATQALFAPDGSLWIRNTAGQGHAHVWTVYNTAGEIAMRLSLPAGFDLRHIRGDRLYGVARTENDAQLVQVYRLVRG